MDSIETTTHSEPETDAPAAETLANASAAPSGGDVPWDLGDLGAIHGPVTLPDGRVCVGRVGAPPQKEATSTSFCFWIPEDALVEATQIVTARCTIAGRDLTYYGLVDEVHRSSRRRGMSHEVDEFDGDLAGEPLFGPDGITYAEAAILRAGTVVDGQEQPIFTPPRERSMVTTATEQEAGAAYGTPEMGDPHEVGQIKNGGSGTAGPGAIDLDYLLGKNGGHMNVNGAAGRGTKSSFLLHSVYLLLAKSRRERLQPSNPDRLRVVPIIFNVKGYDLFHIDRASTGYNSNNHAAAWAVLGIDHPGPFENVTFLAPQQPNNSLAFSIPGRGNEVQPYSWGLQDLIERGLFSFLFASDETMNDNFQALILDLEEFLTNEHTDNSGATVRTLNPAARNANGDPLNTLDALSAWVSSVDATAWGSAGQHHAGTIKKLARRLRLLTLDSRGVLRRGDPTGSPLSVTRQDTSDPIVIDLNRLAGAPWVQRFVVATVLRQLVDAQTYSPVLGLKYLVILDELNRFAPKGGRDAITKLVELVASEMRSQGVLLFGAQQQASLVSEKLIENAGLRVVGKTGMLELSSSEWRGLSQTDKSRANALTPDEKLLLQDSFRKPMHMRIPFPPWAMRRDEATHSGSANGSAPNIAPIDD